MRSLKNIIILLGRVLLSSLFLLSAIYKLLHWQAAEAGLLSIFCDWYGYMSANPDFQPLFSELILWVQPIMITATIVELFGALMIFLGIKIRLGAFLLFIFIIPTTILFHPFWFLQGDKSQIELALFMKNISLIGALILLMANSAKRIKKEIELPSISAEE